MKNCDDGRELDLVLDPALVFRFSVWCNVQRHCFFQSPWINTVGSRTQSKLQRLVQELAIEGGEELDIQVQDSDGLSEGDLQQPSCTGAEPENPTTGQECLVVTDHMPLPAAVVHDEGHDKGPVPTRIGNLFIETCCVLRELWSLCGFVAKSFL